MKIIKSKDNSTYKFATKLLRKKYRDKEGMYLLEGIKPLRDALDLGIPIAKVFISEEFFHITEDETLGSNFLSGFQEVYVLDNELFAKLSETETTQGVIAIAEKEQYGPGKAANMFAEDSGNWVVLDGLQDPGNMGTIIRTAEAAGYRGIVILHGCADVYSPKVVRAAAGSLFRMPIVYGGRSGVDDIIDTLRECGKKIVVTDLEAAVWYDQVELKENIALVIGNEGNGVSREVIDRADIKVKIPMKGSIESLNAAVAAGILMYR
jgi:TrmH family RNA methyltransferase